jgi:hypothetical protein
MLNRIALLILLMASLAYADGFPHGGASPHKPGSEYQGPGILLDTPPFTPGYHNGNGMVCSDCHVMHASMEHDYGYQDPYTYPLEINPPANHLLKASNALDLCLTCHQDKVGVPDVIGGDINGGAERAAGELGDPNAVNDHGHNIGAEPGELCNRCHFGGEFHTATVECVDCHAPHGTNYYRNLQWASWPGHQPPIVAFVNPGATGLQKYQASNVKYGAPGDGPGQPTWREVSNVCIDCHHTLLDASTNGGRYTNYDADFHWNRHPGTNTEWGAYRPISGLPGDPAYSADSTNWFDGQGSEFAIGRLPFLVKEAHDYQAASLVSYNNEVFCISCHSAHGSENAFGLRWNPAESSNPMATSGCRQCHNDVTNDMP